MLVSEKNRISGHAVYTWSVLKMYDLFVGWFSNRFVWGCLSNNILNTYNRFVSSNHLEVGPGTGYFLDRCTFPCGSPRLALLDINNNCLEMTRKRIVRYHPECYNASILEPLNIAVSGFDSISMNYVLHCLPGTMASKESVFVNLKQYLNPGGVIFGTTILGRGVPTGILATAFMTVYNKTGIFSNTCDDREMLSLVLERQFSEHTLKIRGCAAVFSARI